MIIVGSGLCGLTLASLISQRDAEKCIVLEKSRGVGGRMATRRTDAAKFDHGAQFLRSRDESKALRQRFLDRGLLSLWYELDGVSHFNGRDGMTSLAKDLARDSVVQLEHKVLKLSKSAGSWSVELENRPALESKTVVLTCPLPQSLEILKSSQIPFDVQLSKITYEKALVALFEGVEATANVASSHGYIEPANNAIFSVADQFAKGLSRIPAWTVTMSAEFSETNFDQPEPETLDLIEDAVHRFDSGFKSEHRQLKKWRYCRPTSKFTAPFFKVADGLFLAGDAFGGASLNGAIRSAQALVDAL
jgi:renalase